MTGHKLFSYVALTLTASASVCAAQTPPHATINDFIGNWVVTDVVDYADISGGIPEAKRILGMTMTITPQSMSFDSETCKPNTGFTVKRIDTLSALKKQFDLRVNETGLPATTVVVDSDNCFAIFRMDAHRIVFGWDGIIVRAIRDQ
ncbi:hypothetical protein HDG32_001862 [Paraburkholderia sp. CI2]|uniref:Lipocalin-like domain-containing protein n=1 Tax=Paraburkholderia tuberum TaxID=157910 RepID=A0A1H1FRS3_9BURK|nr:MULTISPECIES: hypothetical protein [Paraburkholderia]MBB5456676.1 hypothetical protein [Paraburkholderia sp. Cpub6]MBB5465758.1 hypothetical protein [Paraburkholderia sp. CI2]MBC8721688.1 hypothetical protein [Paraburkholderia sp. 31.1]SDR03468.1 hypothetical protein SAMN05445850_2534 [Paraburkholderia tuberum]